jgi:hypothetical protein
MNLFPFVNPHDMKRVFYRPFLFLGSIGICLGLVGAVQPVRGIASLLYGVEPFDVATLAKSRLFAHLCAKAEYFCKSARCIESRKRMQITDDI